MFLHVTKVKYISDYKLWLHFDNGAEGMVDLEDELWGEVFEPLKDKALFSNVFVNKDTKTISWENGADFAPEFLHDILKSDVDPSSISESNDKKALAIEQFA